MALWNLRGPAAVPFCSHSRIINASLANYDTPGFKLGQLLETGAAEAKAGAHNADGSEDSLVEADAQAQPETHKPMERTMILANRPVPPANHPGEEE